MSNFKLGTYFNKKNMVLVVQAETHNGGYTGYIVRPHSPNLPTFWNKLGKCFDAGGFDLNNEFLIESNIDALVKDVHERLDRIELTLKEHRGRHGIL